MVTETSPYPRFSDEYWMDQALELARQAWADGEVPVGAVVVKNNVLLGQGSNRPIGLSDPTGHAEIIALRQAAQTLGNYRLPGCRLYVTLEPCLMCSGAIFHARLDEVIFGASDPKTGAAGGALNVYPLEGINHQTTLRGGVLAEPSSALLKKFFADRRRRED
ncbi:MAG: tRNA adenosine(34) deaminase TadA [Burkholderiaceae bacterium]